MKLKTLAVLFALTFLCVGLGLPLGHSQNLLEHLSKNQEFKSRRISSYDSTGGNSDRISIEPGETAELAKIKGPGTIHHIWVTVLAESFYGCPLQEPDFKKGSKATVYRHHITDPIPFEESIKVTLEHGHDNNRSDYFSSVAYWYQKEPHKSFPELPDVSQRLPFALASSDEMVIPQWEEILSRGLCILLCSLSGPTTSYPAHRE